MVMDLIRDQGFREQRGEYGSRMGGGEGLDVSRDGRGLIFFFAVLCVSLLKVCGSFRFQCRASQSGL